MLHIMEEWFNLDVCSNPDVAKLAYALASSTSTERYVGSNPTVGTNDMI